MHKLLLAALLTACSGGETQFTQKTDDPNPPSGTGVLTVSPAEVVIADLDWEGAIARSVVFVAENTGDGNLQIYSVKISSAGESDGQSVFYLEELSNLVLSPGGTREITVVATLRTDERVEGEARIKTSAVDSSDFRVPLIALPLGWEAPPDTGSGDTGSGDTGSGDTGGSGSKPAR
jgi:hypothetical protein